MNGHIRQPIDRSDRIFLSQLSLLADICTTEKRRGIAKLLTEHITHYKMALSRVNGAKNSLTSADLAKAGEGETSANTASSPNFLISCTGNEKKHSSSPVLGEKVRLQQDCTSHPVFH